MAKIVNKTKVITGPRTRWSYANVWDPKSINGGTPKFSVSLIIPKSDKKTVEAIKAAIQAAYEEHQRRGGLHPPRMMTAAIRKRRGPDGALCGLSSRSHPCRNGVL